MNRRSFFAFLAATPLAGWLGLKPRLPTATAAMAPYLEARRQAFSKGDLVWLDDDGNLVKTPTMTPEQRHKKALSPKHHMIGFRGWENFIGRPGT